MWLWLQQDELRGFVTPPALGPVVLATTFPVTPPTRQAVGRYFALRFKVRIFSLRWGRGVAVDFRSDSSRNDET